MCGIAGWYSRKPVENGPILMKRMLSEIVHRGPDDEGQYLQGPIALGIRRLSIIDVEGGHQPLCNEDGTVWVVLNGEIYNFQELRSELQGKGHVFATRSDTEVIVHGYEEWGDDCVTHLNGMFGVAIWDARKRRLLLARDHFGVKPLYFYSDKDRLVWGSEIKAILVDPTIPREVDRRALDLYLTFRFVPSPHTMFQNIQKLAPGHRLIQDETSCRVERFFHAPKETQNDRLSESDWIAILQERLEAAVKRQMISDVPIGALLSGGVDSGAVVAIMSQLTDHPVRTFTVGFADSEDINELKEARDTAALFGTQHEEVILRSIDYQDMLQKSIWHMDEPIATMSALAMYSVCRLAREHVTVVLTGQGADEPFAGYVRHRGERYGALYRGIPSSLRNGVISPLIESLPRQERLKRATRSLAIENITERFAKVYAVFSEPMKDALWQPGMVPGESFEHVCGVIDYWRQGVENADPLLQMTYVDTRLSLSDDLLTYGDKMSMAASIEARVPFLDLDYMRAVEALPSSMRIRGKTHKYIHKKAIAKYLPQEVIGRKKRGFDTPIDSWFRSELSGYVRETLLSADSACPIYFQPSAIDALIREHISGRQDHRRQLFSLLTFELWHRQFIGRDRVLDAQSSSLYEARSTTRV